MISAEACLHGVHTTITVYPMSDRMVIVPAVSLDDICALAERAAERIQVMTPGPDDSLVYALRGAAREIRAHSVLDPCPT